MNTSKPLFQKIKLKNIIIVSLLIGFLLLVYSFNKLNETKPITISGFYFDTFVNITIYDDITLETQDDIISLLSYYDTIFSPDNKESLIAKVNDNISINNEEDLSEIMQIALSICNETDGIVDPTIYPIYDLYDFNPENTTNPSFDEIDDLLKNVDYKTISIVDDNIIKTNASTKIGLGFIAKGYIADKIKDLLINKKINNAVIDLGGNILVLGNKHNKGYNIGIQNPYSSLDSDIYLDYTYDENIKDFINALANTTSPKAKNKLDNSSPVIAVSINDESMVTSGIYERYYLSEDKVMHHLLDVHTGLPVDNELLSVTIIGPSSTLCDAYSTACFLMGTEKAIDFLDTKKGYHGIFITKCNDILYSHNFPFEKIISY